MFDWQWVNIGSCNGLAPNRRQAITSTNVAQWHHMASMGRSESEATLLNFPDNKVHGANMGPIRVLSPPDWPHVGPKNLAIRVSLLNGWNAWVTMVVTKITPGHLQPSGWLRLYYWVQHSLKNTVLSLNTLINTFCINEAVWCWKRSPKKELVKAII